MKAYLGVDVGSVSTNIVAVDDSGSLIEKLYLRTNGQPINVLQNGMKKLQQRLGGNVKIVGVGTTGSARRLAAVLLGADTVKNEITAHAVAALKEEPGVKTVLEIGGQDSKIILLRNGTVSDFAMNTVCAAGTGSFLDQQASRLNIPIEEFGRLALKSKTEVRIAGRCSVFAESDMIHKQQMGHNLSDIIAGLCRALVRNYLSNLGKGKDIKPPVIFQGGVAANQGMGQAFEEALNTEIIVPRNFSVMGALGAAILGREAVEKGKGKTKFKGFESAKTDFKVKSFECEGCANQCEVIEITDSYKVLARWGDKCGKWAEIEPEEEKPAVKTDLKLSTS